MATKKYSCIECGDEDFSWYTWIKSGKSVPLCKKHAKGKFGIRKDGKEKRDAEAHQRKEVLDELKEIKASHGGPVTRTYYDYKTDKYKKYTTDRNGDRMFDDNGVPLAKDKRRKFTEIRHRKKRY